MIALIQRVSHAQVTVDNNIVGKINHGILALIGVEKEDDAQKADRLLERILGYRIFEDANGKMNLSLRDIHGGLLLVPQFTLPADTKKGTRPSFTPAAEPKKGKELFDYFFKVAKQKHAVVEQGQFGAHMHVELCNDGPVTFILQSSTPSSESI